jgi:GNAT superfamily N-acetyltransferase
MNIRSFTNQDAQKLVSLWNCAHPQYPLTEGQMAKKLFLDTNFLAENLLIVEENQEMIAFAYVPHHLSMQEDAGYITYFSVSPERDVETVGAFLLKACETHHKDAGRSRVSTAYTPLYHLQGFSDQYDVPYVKLFRSFGYEEEKSYRRRIDLNAYSLPENWALRKQQLAEEVIYIGALSYDLIAQFVSAENGFSSGNWSWEYRVRLSHDPDPTRARVAIHKGKIIGGCIFGDPNSDDGRFGPFGMNPEYRGKGIGSILFADCLQEMKARGISCAWAQWTPLTGPAAKLYDRAGFMMQDCFVTFEKKLG